MYRWCRLLALAGLFLLPRGVGATGGETEALIDQAFVFYGDLDYEKALGALQKAFRVPGNTRGQLVRMYHLSGLCLGSLGRYQEAETSFGRLLVLDPSFRLGADVSPRIREPFDQLWKKNIPRLNVRLVPPAYARPGQPLAFGAQVAADPAGMIAAVRVFFRRGQTGKFSSIRSLLQGREEQTVTVSPAAWEGDGKGGKIFWYAQVEGAHRSRLQEFGDAEHPSVLEIYEKSAAEMAAAGEIAWYQRWWVWAIVGGVAAAATTAAVLTTAQTPAGPFDFSVDFSTSE